MLAQELGSALGTKLDEQILAGSGSSGQMLGLLSVTGITSVAYTDATPTPQEAFPKILEAASTLATALGDVPTAILMHPRRLFWFQNWRDTAGLPANIPWPAPVFAVPGLSTTNGAGTNEDIVLIVRLDELPLYLGPPQVEVFPEVLSSTLTVRVRARQYASGLFTRRPEAIAKVSGTGFASPTFS